MSYPKTVEALGHNVPLVFMGVFGVGTTLAGLAGVIAGPSLETFPGMAIVLGSVFACYDCDRWVGITLGCPCGISAHWLDYNLCDIL